MKRETGQQKKAVVQHEETKEEEEQQQTAHLPRRLPPLPAPAFWPLWPMICRMKARVPVIALSVVVENGLLAKGGLQWMLTAIRTNTGLPLFRDGRKIGPVVHGMRVPWQCETRAKWERVETGEQERQSYLKLETGERERQEKTGKQEWPEWEEVPRSVDIVLLPA